MTVFWSESIYLPTLSTKARIEFSTLFQILFSIEFSIPHPDIKPILGHWAIESWLLVFLVCTYIPLHTITLWPCFCWPHLSAPVSFPTARDRFWHLPVVSAISIKQPWQFRCVEAHTITITSIDSYKRLKTRVSGGRINLDCSCDVIHCARASAFGGHPPPTDNVRCCQPRPTLSHNVPLPCLTMPHA